MEWEEALKRLDDAVLKKTNKPLTLTPQELKILEGIWNGEGYQSIADNMGYEVGTISKDTAPKLLNRLTEALKEKITKKNFRSVMMTLHASIPAIESNNSTESNSNQNKEAVGNISDNGEINILKSEIKYKAQKIQDLQVKLDDANKNIEYLNNIVNSLLKQLDQHGINIPLHNLKNQLKALNLEENWRLCETLEEVVKVKQNSWVEDAGKFALEKHPEITVPSGLVGSSEKRKAFYKDIREYLNWLIFCLSKKDDFALDEVNIERAIPFKSLYKDAFKFIKDEKTIGMETKELKLLEYYLNLLIDFFS